MGCFMQIQGPRNFKDMVSASAPTPPHPILETSRQPIKSRLAGHSPAVALVSACKRSSHIPEEFSGLLGQQ